MTRDFCGAGICFSSRRRLNWGHLVLSLGFYVLGLYAEETMTRAPVRDNSAGGVVLSG